MAFWMFVILLWHLYISSYISQLYFVHLCMIDTDEFT